MVSNMKTTIDLPDELLIAAKKHAAEHRTTLRSLVTRGLLHELEELSSRGDDMTPVRIRWVVAEGGLAPSVDVSDREQMHEWLDRKP